MAVFSNCVHKNFSLQLNQERPLLNPLLSKLFTVMFLCCILSCVKDYKLAGSNTWISIAGDSCCTDVWWGTEQWAAPGWCGRHSSHWQQTHWFQWGAVAGWNSRGHSPRCEKSRDTLPLPCCYTCAKPSVYVIQTLSAAKYSSHGNTCSSSQKWTPYTCSWECLRGI